mgnify:CR=1 FL=1
MSQKKLHMRNDPFEEYLKEIEPAKEQKGYLWNTAIGLQAVDGLKPSSYLIDTAIQNIEGDISLSEAEPRIESYYENKPASATEERTEEADKVSVRIAQILSESSFSFSPIEYLSIHRRLFSGIYDHAGKIRDYNITKKEWVLNGETVIYGSASELWEMLKYDFDQERNFEYKYLSMDEIIHHLARLISNLWQIHVFGEGNTRTTAVFFIRYLRTLGFYVTNDIFAKNVWYFRNALVRANYSDLRNGIHETTEYLELFLRNLLLDEKHELKNRYLHISGTFKPAKLTIGNNNMKYNAETENNNEKSTNIDVIFAGKTSALSNVTRKHLQIMFAEYGFHLIFGRTMVKELLQLQSSSVSNLFSKLRAQNIIQQVPGAGKGKYRFVK